MTQQYIGRRSTDQGTGGTDWIPCPEGIYRFEVGAGAVKLSRFKSQKGEDQYSVSFKMKLPKEEYERAKKIYEGDILEGQELSGQTQYACGLTLGWWKGTEYQTTRLADFLTTLLGNRQQKELRKYIMDGGGPFITPDGSVETQISEWNTWFAWFDGCMVLGTISHRPDSSGNGKIWADFGGPVAIGMPGTMGAPDPDYQAFGRGKLRMLLRQGNGVVAASEPEPEPVPVTYTAQGEPIDTTTGEIDATDDEEATLLAQLEEARKRKATANREKVAAATGAPTVDNKDYERLFGEPAKA